MLVITRRVSESILIGSDIVITIVRIGEDKVRIGVTAPKEITILRSEIGPWDSNKRKES